MKTDYFLKFMSWVLGNIWYCYFSKSACALPDANYRFLTELCSTDMIIIVFSKGYKTMSFIECFGFGVLRQGFSVYP